MLDFNFLVICRAGDLFVGNDDVGVIRNSFVGLGLFLFLRLALGLSCFLRLGFICRPILSSTIGCRLCRVCRCEIGELCIAEIEEHGDVVLFGLKLDRAVALSIRHHECNVIKKRVARFVGLDLQVLIQSAEVGIVSGAFHALRDLSNLQFSIIRHCIRRFQVYDDAKALLVVIDIDRLLLLFRLILQSDDSVFLKLDVFFACFIRKACLPRLLIYFLAQAVNRRAVDLCFLICIGNFIGAGRALNALDLLYFLVDRSFLQVDGVLERRKILFLIIFDCFTIFVDDFIGQLDLRRVFFIVKGDRGVFRHLDFFAVNDHVISNGLFVELMDDFLLCGGAVFCFISIFCAAVCGCCFFRFICRSCIGRSFALCRTITGLCLDLFGGLFSDLRYLGIIDCCFYICISINHTSVISVERKRGLVAVQGDGLSVRAFDCLAVRVDIFRGELDLGINDLFFDHDLLVGLVRLFLSLHGFISVDNRQSIRHCSL